MSIQEIENKVRELRQLQALIEEATAEAEAIKDTIKAQMGDNEELRDLLQAGQQGPQGGAAGGGPALHQDHHLPPVLRSVKKAPCITANQSTMQGATNQNHGGPGALSVPRPPENYKENFDYERDRENEAVHRADKDG